MNTKTGYTKDVSKVDPSWAPLSPPLFLKFHPSVVLSLKHPNKAPKWGANPEWDSQTRHNNFFWGSPTGCPPMGYAMRLYMLGLGG